VADCTQCTDGEVAPACRALVLDARARAERDLAQYQNIRQQLLTETDPAGDRSYWLLTGSAGEHTARAAIAWADEALADLDRLDQPPQDPAAPATTTRTRGQTTQRRKP
jgi:hypothetical protein